MLLRVILNEAGFMAGGILHINDDHIKMAYTDISGVRYVVDSDGDKHAVDEATFERVRRFLDN